MHGHTERVWDSCYLGEGRIASVSEVGARLDHLHLSLVLTLRFSLYLRTGWHLSRMGHAYRDLSRVAAGYALLAH
jgi:hypothetical protein